MGSCCTMECVGRKRKRSCASAGHFWGHHAHSLIVLVLVLASVHATPLDYYKVSPYARRLYSRHEQVWSPTPTLRSGGSFGVLVARCHGHSMTSACACGALRTTDLFSFNQVLGVSRDASAREIKKAYRAKALELHPDKLGPNVTEADEQAFIDVATAYEVLSDPSKRRRYDSFGPEVSERRCRQSLSSLPPPPPRSMLPWWRVTPRCVFAPIPRKEHQRWW